MTVACRRCGRELEAPARHRAVAGLECPAGDQEFAEARPELVLSRTRAELLASVVRLARDGRADGWVLLEPRQGPAARDLGRAGLVELHGHDPKKGMFGALYARPAARSLPTKDAVEVVKASGRAILAESKRSDSIEGMAKKPAADEPDDLKPVLVRMPAELHAALTALASHEGRSLNKQIVYLLERAPGVGLKGV